MNKARSIVITGCSSGFGRLTSLALARKGWRVFATVRKAEDRESLRTEAEAAGVGEMLSIILCDITSSEQVAAMAQEVRAQLQEPGADSTVVPPLDALLNNAGTAYGGPIELLPLDDLRAQFEINVVAHVSVIQALLPLLKAAKGTLINVSSVSGLIAIPIVGAYAASKFALEAISDALRLELAPSGVRVVVIEPTSSPTGIWATSLQRTLPIMEQHRSGGYERLLTLTEKSARRSSQKGFSPQLFVNTVIHILDTEHPKTRYVVPGRARAQVWLRRLLPDRLWDRLLRRTLKW